jgi:glycine/D-amino acid oxidase-like deaminating enzyme
LEKADILVIGGGIIGASATFFLSKGHVDVTLVDKSEIGRGASGATAGSMSFQNKEQKLLPLVQESLSIWSSLQKEVEEDIEFRQPGGFRVAEDAHQFEALRQSVFKQKELGLRVELLSGRELSAIGPYFGSTVVAASFCELDARSNPLTASTGLARAAQKRGAKIYENEEVKKISIEGINRYLVETSKRSIQSSCVLNSAGVWSKNIFEMVGLNFPITLDPMQVMVTEQSSPIFSHIITHLKGNLTLKQVDSGNIVIGGGWKGIGDAGKNLKEVNYDSLKGNIQLACRVIPALQSLNLIRCWTGLEGRTPDHLPLLGRVNHLPNFFVATCAKGGYTLGPLLGRLASELILTNKPSFPIEDFNVNRLLSH